VLYLHGGDLSQVTSTHTIRCAGNYRITFRQSR
jgi:hypothetical protein